jgi:peptidoglycan/xylan/chitin deacetylase (PgdA/CDA1 family)
MADIHVMLGVDMETDIGSWTPFYEGVVHGTPRLMNLFAEKGVPCTGFWVAEAAKRHPEVLRDMQSAGHEIGAHSLYHETIGDELFEIPGVYPLLPHEVKPRCELATNIVADIAGERPVSWRCPRLFGGTAVTNALEELGYLCDATYPLYFHEKQLYPYHPAAEDWTQTGDLKLVELVQFADMTIDSTDPHGRDRDQWPLYRTQSCEAFIPHVENYIRYTEEHGAKDAAGNALPVVLSFYIHPWEFWPMREGVIHFGEGGVQPDPFIIEGCGDYCLQQMGLVLDWLQDQGATFQTAGDVARDWQTILAA